VPPGIFPPVRWPADFSPVDLLDVLAVAALIYAVLSGLRRRRVPHALPGLLACVLLVVGARLAGMRLVSFLFGGLVPAVLLALVILFQDELRRFLDWMTPWGLERRRPAEPLDATARALDELARTMYSLADRKVGALVVLVGRLPLARHLSGGVPLGGQLSAPLLESLFDPATPGHDGAMILEDARVVSFGAHLPLSTRGDALRGHGTRHAAALGLSERSDALCVVVSEERGRVSIARGGELTEPGSAEELATHLRAHLRERRGLPEKRGLWRAPLRQLPLKLAALATSALMWFFFVHESVTEYRRFTVPVGQLGLDPGLVLERAAPAAVDLIVSGPRRAFYFVDEDELGVRLKLFDAAAGTSEEYLTASEVTLPDGLEFVNLVPRTVAVTVVRR
jgi:uncharacterized protein (TIGR00159 family)